MNLILFGFNGCGKSYFGARLAKKLSYSFIDTDEVLVRFLGSRSLSVRDLFQSLGAESFRLLERRVFHEISCVSHSVISVGGGSLFSPENLRVCRFLGPLLFLDASYSLILSRLFPLGAPAFIRSSQPFEDLHHLFVERRPFYRLLASHRISVDAHDNEQILQQLLSFTYGEHFNHGL